MCTNMAFDGHIVISCESEEAISDSPARISVMVNGRLEAVIDAVAESAKGADGKMYPVVVFKMVPLDDGK